jgi:DNA repair exonuclease SbcCD ATPase subunit
VAVETEADDRPRANGTTPSGVKNQKAAAIKENEILGAVAGLNLEGVSGTIAATQVEVQKSLADLSAKLAERLQLLQHVEEAINLKRDDLKQLYDIEAAAVELDDLMAKIDAQRESWDEEQARKRREFEEQRSDRTKQWAREEADYQYNLNLQRKKSEDDFKYQLAGLDRANKDRQAQLDKDWAEREAELKKHEKDVEDLRAQVANMPEVLKKEVNAAVAVSTNSVKKEYETKAMLSAKDAETAAKLATQEAAALRQALEKTNGQIAELKGQFEQAHRDVKEISSKALESASGRSTLETLTKVLENDQTSKPGK